MKKTLTIISLLAGAVAVHAQGQISWQCYVGGVWSPSIWSVGSAPTVQTVGNTGADLPSGGTTYAGSVLLGGLATGAGATGAGLYNGNNWEVGLYLDTSTAAVRNDVLTGAAAPVATSLLITSGGSGNGGYWPP